MTASEFTDDMLGEQAADWFNAADALRRGDRSAAADFIAGPPCDDVTCYTRGVTLCVIGASVIAAEIAKLNGHKLGDAPGMYVLQSQHPLGILTPDQRCAAQCITYASNGDFEMVADLVNAHHRPDDVAAGCNLLMALMTVYVGITAGAS